MGGVVCEL
ncbi:unnamed protein product [Ophioblennius macclurei]